MKDRLAPGSPAPLAGALAWIKAYLLEPVEHTCPGDHRATCPVVAVVGLTPRCGTTTVARGLAATLAVRDGEGAALVWSDRSGPAHALGSAGATRLASELSRSCGRVRAAGRLCLVEDADPATMVRTARDVAPVVLEVGHGSVPSVPAALAEHVVLVVPPSVEWALPAAVATSISRVGPAPTIVANGGRGEDAAGGIAGALPLPHSRAGAYLALAGRRPLGPFGAAVAKLADLCATGERP